MSEDRPRSDHFFFGFFMGGLIGAFIVFLMGTKEGKKLAKKIQDKMSEKGELFEEEIEENVGKLQKKGEELIEQAETIKKKISDEVDGRKKTASDQLITKMDETLTKIEDLQKKGVELTQDVHKKFFKKNGRKLTN